MKQLLDPVAGLDVHRDNVVAATRTVGADGEVAFTKVRFPTNRRGIAELAGHMTQAGVVRVAMEATGVYWKSLYYSLEGLFPELWLCNAQHVKNVPGRKSDLSDAEWGQRRAEWRPPAPHYTTGVMARYAALVGSASEGAVLELPAF